MCAATSQMVAKVAELMELRKMIEDLNAEAELIADEIKAYAACAFDTIGSALYDLRRGRSMNFKANESTQKLTGSYYTPAWIADFVARWVAAHKPQSILEPSCGDGVFFESLLKYLNPADLILRGFDIDAVAVEKTLSRDSLKKASAEIKCGDYLDWAIQNVSSTTPQKFDAIVGNPPFIRYQYLEKEQQDNAQKLFSLMGMKFTKHTNAWIPFVLSSISFLNPDGILGMVIPSEILHVLYAQGLREYLLKECSHILLIDPEDLWFEDTLQKGLIEHCLKQTLLLQQQDGHYLALSLAI